jgi:hypothetical protein
MDDLVEKLEKRGYAVDRLFEFANSAKAREDLAKHLRDIVPDINGNVDNLIEDLGLYLQETVGKTTWSAWEYIKSIPRRIWNTIKKHPRTAALVGSAALLGVAYFSGVTPAVAVGYARSWLGKYLVNTGLGEALGLGAEAVEAVGAAAESGAAALEGAEAAMGEMIEATPMGDLPLPTPPAAPGPINLPSTMEEASEVFRALERSG